jgi:hypothetical protein
MMQGDLAHATDQSVFVTRPWGRVGAVRGGRAVECGDVLVCLGSVRCQLRNEADFDTHLTDTDSDRSL